MVNESRIVDFLKARIKEHTKYSDKPFRANSIIGVFNRDKVKREWFKTRYASESQYLDFIHKHKRHFVYDKETGNISINRNPCVKPLVFDEYVSGNNQKLKEEMVKITLLIEILKYLKEAEDGNEKCRGEVGILRDDLLNHFAAQVKNVFQSPTEDQLAHEFRMFCMDQKTFLKTKKEFNKEKDEHEFKIYLNAFNDRRIFNPNFIDEVFESITELGKDLVTNAVKNFLQVDPSRKGGWKEISDICDYLGANFPDLSSIAFDAVYFDCDDVKNHLIDCDDDFEVDSENEKVTLKANVTAKPQKAAGVLLYETKGKTLREVTGVVDAVAEFEVIIYADIDDYKRVKFEADLSTGDHATPDIKEGETVTFNARYDDEKNKWIATRITNIERDN